MPGTLILCAGPIGNLEDASPRLGRTLASADVVFVEDTRRSKTLLSYLGVEVPMRSYFVGNEEHRSSELRRRLEEGETVALLTDAGTPAVADPGVSAVKAALEAGADITSIPGPSAVTMALSVSGHSADRFVFEGFLPRKGGERRRRIAAIAGDERTAVLFCAPGRLAADLAELAALAPGRGVVVCREMTKIYEELWRGSLEEAVEEWSDRDVRGEVTVVLGPGERVEPDLDDAVRRVRRAIADGERPSEAVRRIAAVTGVSRRRLYDEVVGS